jgi:sigma-B regulation protein RsbU (phosphoserine phosphatase)
VNKRALELVDCGHTGIVFRHGATGVCEVLHGDNLPLGVREGEIYNQITVAFEPEDLLLFFSDGITEARNPVGEFFGVERLVEFVRSHAELEPAMLVEAVRKEVFEFSGSGRLADDLTSVAVRVEEKRVPVARADVEIRSDLKELRQVREFVRSFCRNLPGPSMDEERADALELAVNEAASNIMKHAYHGREDQWIHLEGEAFPGSVSIRLHHLGDPFDPSAAPAPVLDGSRESGRGTYIISQSVDQVRYYRDERGRNCVDLMKIRNTETSKAQDLKARSEP